MRSPARSCLGCACALIVRKTGSVWGAAAARTLAGVLYMTIYFGRV